MESRFHYVKLDNPPMKDIGKTCLTILKKEKIKYDPKNVIDIVKKCYPDIRKTINVLQQNTVNGKLTGSRISISEALWEKILRLIIKQDVEEVRKELRSNYIDYPDLYKFLYENAGEFKEPGAAILTIGEHLYRDATIAIKEINFMRMVVYMIFNKVV